MAIERESRWSSPPPSEEIRARLGAIAVVGNSAPLVTDFSKPMSRGKGAAKGALFGTAAIVGLGSLGGGYGFIAGLFLSPVGAVSGTICGTIAGMSKAEYKTICRNLNQTIRELTLAPRLASATADLIGDSTSQKIITCTNSSIGTEKNAIDYRLLRELGAQTVLELTVSRIELAGESGIGAPVGIDPPLRLCWVLQTRLLRLDNGSELFNGNLDYHGASYELRKWAANDGCLLREDINRAFPLLTTEVVEHLFLRNLVD